MSTRPGTEPFVSIPVRLLNVLTAAVLVAWLAVACYALAYLVAH